MTPLEIVVDTREQAPWVFGGVPSVRRALTAGDYSPAGLERRCAIERKARGDLISTLTYGRERFERELERLASYDRAVIIVEADLDDIINWRYRSAVSPKCILGSVASFEARFGIGTIWAGNARNATFLATAILKKWHKHLSTAIEGEAA